MARHSGNAVKVTPFLRDGLIAVPIRLLLFCVFLNAALWGQSSPHWVEVKTSQSENAGSEGQSVQVFLLDQNGRLFVSGDQKLTVNALHRFDLSGPFVYQGTTLKPGDLAVHNKAGNAVRVTRFTISTRPNEKFTDFFKDVHEQEPPNRCNGTLYGRVTFPAGSVKRFFKKSPKGSPCKSQVMKAVNMPASPLGDVGSDRDGDGVADADDNCPDTPNADQADFDGDGVGDVCDDTPQGPDSDGDGVLDYQDNCVDTANADQADFDGDGVGDVCDATPRGPDSDGDGVADVDDNCPETANADQVDFDEDGEGDVCDDTPRGPDSDGDGVPDVDDNCPETANADQVDFDEDGEGDVCDDTPRGPDSDGDGVVDLEDNCPETANADQADFDGDGEGDVCDDTPRGPDSDGDGVADIDDNCPNTANPDQIDTDEDGLGNTCDDTPYGPDTDGDGWYDIEDNCINTPNPLQTDSNNDRIGDLCSSRTLHFDNDPADDYSFATYNDAATVVDQLGVDVDLATFNLVTAPQRGSLTLNGSELVYTPHGGFEGQDTFSYTFDSIHGVRDQADVQMNLILGDCLTSQFGGSEDGLAVLVPNHVVSQDLIGNTAVYEQLSQATEFPTRAHMNLKTLTVDLGTNSLAGDQLTLSFQARPENLEETQLLFDSNSLRIVQAADQLVFELLNGDEVLTQVTNPGLLHLYTCNIVAVQLDAASLTTFVNGETSTTTLNVPAADLAERLHFTAHNGDLWNIRFYERLLTADELAVLGENCLPNSALATRHADYPNYMCGIYVCQFWEPETANATESNLNHYITRQDEVFERNIFDLGMSPRGSLCDYQQEGPNKDLLLSDGIARTFVRPYSLENPLTQTNGQFWLHENFHSFQGPLKRYNGFGGNKYILEASASWGPHQDIEAVRDTLLAYYTANPHLAQWVINGSPTEDKAGHDRQGGHAYGASIWWHYLTKTIGYPRLIGDMFNDRRVGSEPMRVAKELVEAEGHDFAELFIDFAAAVTTWDMEHEALWRESEEASLNRMANNTTREAIDHRYTAVMDATATCGTWAGVPVAYQPGSWAHNVFRVDVTDSAESYRVAVQSDALVQNPGQLRARVIAYNEQTGERRVTVLETSADSANPTEVTVDVNAGETLFLVVATTPDAFSGWDTYTYNYRIEPVATSCN